MHEAELRLSDDLDRRFRKPLLTFFLKRGMNRAEAEDLTQEVFTRLARHPNKSRAAGMAAYVFMIAANLLKDRGRAQSARHASAHSSLNDIIDDLEAIPPSLIEDRTPERVLTAKETLRDILGAFKELAEPTRAIFVLSRLENMRHREIAVIYGISASAVEKHVMKATAHLGARFLAR